MLKKLLLPLFFLLFMVSGFTQTIVSTSPQNRNVVLEEFTGIYCVYCPEGHSIAQGMKNNNPERVSLINIHVGGYAIPGENDPDFRTQWGNAIANASDLTGYPAGQVNRHIFPGRGMSGSSTAMGRGYWSMSGNEVLGMTSYVNIGVEATIDAQSRELTVHVEGYYTGNSPEDFNLLNVALLQNNTKGPQTGGNMGNNYNHMHRLVDLLTGQWGDTIPTTTQGTFIDRTYTYSLPYEYRNVDVVLGNMEVVAFISETQKEIMTGSTATPQVINLLNNDARAKRIQKIDPQCSSQISPSIIVSNEGIETLTTLDIEYSVNGANHSYTWNGSLETFEETTIELPEVAFNLTETNLITVTIPNDDDNSNNSTSLEFEKAAEGTSSVTVDVRTDDWGYEFSYEIVNSNGDVVQRRTSFPNNQTVSDSYELPEDCYNIIIRDSYGDGGARIEVKDSNNQRLFFASGNWGAKKDGNFSTNGALGVEDHINHFLSVYPNPADNTLTISGVENANIAIYDILGKEIFTKENITALEEVRVSQLQAGTYFLKISRNGETTTKKFIKN